MIEKLRELGVQTKALYASEAESGHLIVKVKGNASISLTPPSHTTLRRKMCCVACGRDTQKACSTRQAVK